ncbi:hypothetical protein JYQ62_07370 [Nostoc sp. UHCC 0702]|nr:hypothetical protein JYQ62_07370 [Nostoc sp. UHCC 0702]
MVAQAITLFPYIASLLNYKFYLVVEKAIASELSALEPSRTLQSRLIKNCHRYNSNPQI